LGDVAIEFAHVLADEGVAFAFLEGVLEELMDGGHEMRGGEGRNVYLLLRRWLP
jgi:hypothetical protein